MFKINNENEIEFNSEILLTTFSEKEKRRMKEFEKVIFLRQKGFLPSQISRLLGIPKQRVASWLFANKKPIAVNAIEICKKRGLLPMRTDLKRFIVLLDIFSWIFGDGNLGKTLNTITLSGRKNDLEKIAKSITSAFGFKCEIKTAPGSKNKDNCALIIRGKGTRALCRLLKGLGAPVGNKVEKAFLLPQWVFLLKPKLKKRLLEVFMSNEIGIGHLEKNGQMPCIRIKMRKTKKEVQNLIGFLNQIGVLLKEFGIKVSEAKIVKEVVDNKGVKCDVVLNISKAIRNVFTFSSTFKMIFAKEKQERLEILKEAAERKMNLNENFNFIIQ
ncbi:MAG: hypothetical protein QXD54_00135 [Candidatus Aenigmatarchaeota archaeon]